MPESERRRRCRLQALARGSHPPRLCFVDRPSPEVHGETFGALSIYAPDADAFDVEEAAQLGELANNLAYGILSLRNRAQRERAEAALEKAKDAAEAASQA